MFKSIRIASAVIMLCWLLSSCEKQYLELIPVLQIEKDLSIAGAGDIKFFSFPSENVGYAATESAALYKTTDAGNTWTKLTTSFTANCEGLEFFDAQNGMCLVNGAVYVTENGGQSWLLRDYSDFIGITQDGVGVIGRECAYKMHCIYTTTTKGKSFQSLGKVTLENDFAFAKVTGSKAYLIPANVVLEDAFYGIDIKTKQVEKVALNNIIYDEIPKDIFVSNQLGYIVGGGGLIMERREDFSATSSFYSQVNSYNGQQYLSVDGFNELAVGVGQKTISVNVDFGKGGTWTELLSPSGKSFQHTFYKVKFLSENSFYISGSNGLLWKAKL